MNIQIGNSSVSKITSQEDMNVFVQSLGLKSDTVIIKPNWVDGREGTHTDSHVLDMFLTAIARPVVIVESYTFWRTDKTTKGEGDYFSSKEADIENGIKHWDFYKEQDIKFLQTEGLDKVLGKHQAAYLNITNEIWSGKKASPETLKKLTESAHGPVVNEDLYNYIPLRLFDLKGSDFISFAKAKIDGGCGLSLSIKNLFGLIPDPYRFNKYHGGFDGPELAQNIIDINNIYKSIFNVIYTFEGIFTASDMDWASGKNTPIHDWGVIVGGSDGCNVDRIGEILLKRPIAGQLANLLAMYKSLFSPDPIGDIAKIPEELKINY